VERRFWDRLDDDLDTPGALTVLDELEALLQNPLPARDPAQVTDGGPLLDRLLDTLGSRSASVAV